MNEFLTAEKACSLVDSTDLVIVLLLLGADGRSFCSNGAVCVCVLVFMFLCVPVCERALGRVVSVCIWCVHVSLGVC